MTTSVPAKTVGRPKGSGAPASDAVKRVRLALGITQAAMAFRLGIAESTLQRLERLERLPIGQPVMQKLRDQARGAGVTI